MNLFLLLLCAAIFMGWNQILRKGAYPESIPLPLKIKHFSALVVIVLFSWDGFSVLVSLIFAKLSIQSASHLLIFIWIMHSLLGAACLLLCHGAAARWKGALIWLRVLFPAYMIFDLILFFSGIGKDFNQFKKTAVAFLFVIPLAMIAAFYFRKENIKLLCGK